MQKYKEVNGNLIQLAKEGTFDVIAHGCNCFCTMGAGIAPVMAEAFGCNKYTMESFMHKGDIDKLGRIEYRPVHIKGDHIFTHLSERTYFDGELQGYKEVNVVNCYTQYGFGLNHAGGISAPLDYEALTLCMRKINHIFKGKHVGLPQIGCGLAGGDWEIVREIMIKELKDCNLTVVIFDKNEHKENRHSFKVL